MITVEEKNAAVSESDQKGQTAGKESRAQAEGGGKEAGESDHNPAAENGSNSSAQGMNKVQLSSAGCATCIGTVVAVSSDKMGSGNDELGAVLMKSFFLRRRSLIRFRIKSFLQRRRETYGGRFGLPRRYQDFGKEGVEILTCGTCLDFYGLKENWQSEQ